MGIKRKILGPHFLNEYPWALFSPFFIHRRHLFKSIKSAAATVSGDILDFGCGSKPYESLFNHQKYLGIDIENPGHSHTNEKIDAIFDGVNIPYPDHSFDACIASEVLEHVIEPDKVLREIGRVLKPNGILILTTPFVWDEHEAPNDFYRYTSFGLERTVSSNHFDVVSQEKLGSFPELIFQLTLIKLNRFMSTNKPARIIFFLFLCPPLNLMSLLLSSCFSRQGSIFLGQTLVARKQNA